MSLLWCMLKSWASASDCSETVLPVLTVLWYQSFWGVWPQAWADNLNTRLLSGTTVSCSWVLSVCHTDCGGRQISLVFCCAKSCYWNCVKKRIGQLAVCGGCGYCHCHLISQIHIYLRYNHVSDKSFSCCEWNVTDFKFQAMKIFLFV